MCVIVFVYFLLVYLHVLCAVFWTVGEIKEGILRIGKTVIPVYTPETKMKVPDVLFYENAQVKWMFVPLLVCLVAGVSVHAVSLDVHISGFLTLLGMFHFCPVRAL